MKKTFLFLSFLFVYQLISADNIPLPEHPRPDFERSEWINLNGVWSFTFDGQTAEKSVTAN
ncbi:MAG: hypothetical protein LBR18_08475, partial [Tannerella sp.]|nr:hypothetical protein [Tannerella sp.]